MTQTVILVGNRQRETAKHLIDRAPGGSVCKISPPKRTLPQNDKMWAMLSDVSRQKPQGRIMPPHKWKAVFMDAIGCKPEWSPSLDGESVVCTGYRSSRMSKSEMSDLIEQMYAYGAEHSVVWTDEQKENEQ